MTAPLLSWITVAHQSSRQLARALASLRREAGQAGIAVEAVVVDHSEDAAELDRLRALAPEILLARPNRGYAAGLNAGWGASTGRLLLFGNPDLEFTRGSLEALVEALAERPIVGPQFVLGKFLLPPAEEQSPWREAWRTAAERSQVACRAHLRAEAARWRAVWEAAGPIEVPTLSGALVACGRDVADRLGPWDEGYFLYFEETEWLRRARRLGLRMAVVPRSRVIHFWGHAADPRSPASAAHFGSSRRRFYRRNFGWLGAWLTRGRSPVPPPPCPSLPAAACAPGEPRWWLVSPRPWGYPAAGGYFDGAALVAALAELRRLVPALADPWVTPWTPPRPPGATYRAPPAAGDERAARPRAPRRVRPAREDDAEALTELFARKFGHRVTAAAWRWKYGACAANRPCSVVVENGDGRIVAHAGALGHAARWRGEEGELFQLCDYLALDREAGLVPNIVRAGRALLEELASRPALPWVYGFPSPKAFALGVRSFGYLPARRLQVLSGDLPEDAELPPGLYESSDRAGAWGARAWEQCSVEGVVRSQAFLDWRFTARPDRYYRVYRLRAGTQDGVAVFGFHEQSAIAAELWLPPGSDWRAPLAAVAGDLRRMGMRTWSFWPPAGPEAEAALKALGVVDSGESVFVGVRALDPAIDPRRASEGVYFSRGDFDMT